MVLKVTVVAVVCLFASVLANSCKLRIYNGNLPIFTQNLGKVEMVLDINTGVIHLEDGESIYVYCQSPFSFYIQDDYYSRTRILEANFNEDRIYCKKGKFFFESIEKELSQDFAISCKKVASYFKHNVKNCNETGIAYGFKLNGIPVVFTEFCYNMALTKVEFMRLRSGIRSPILANQEMFNPTPANYSLESDIQFNKIITAEEELKLKEAVSKTFFDYRKLLNFEIGPILPSEISFGLWDKYIDTLHILNAAPFWASLKYGNWANLGRALSSLSDDAKYEVYAGTSGALPSSYGCQKEEGKPFTYYVSYWKRTVPLYIWNYIVDSNGSGDGVVIIGVNSPFVQISADNNSVIFCNDICDTYKWLDLLKNTRKIPALGYIFCCSPKEARTKLKNFPKIKI